MAQSSLFPEPAPAAEAPPAAPDPYGRDELNLIELAFTTLGRARSRKTLRTEWVGQDHKGRSRKFYKIVTGSDEFGLPEYASEELLIALFHKASREDFGSRSVTAVPYELLQLMDWGTDGRAYQRLRRALDQLAGVYISTNALWNAEAGTFTKAGFHILDDYEFTEDPDTGRTTLSVNWNEKLFSIFRQNRFKRLDTGFFYALPSPVAKRLYRWLDKHLRSRDRVEIDVMHLAHVKLEVSRSKKFVSAVMQVLQPALEELAARGYCTWSLEDSQTESGKKLVFRRAQPLPGRSSGGAAPGPTLSDEQRALVEALTSRGVSADAAHELAADYDAERVGRQLRHFDHLVATGQPPRSAGWLVRAVEQDFGLPPALLQEEHRAQREAAEAARRRTEADRAAARRAEDAEREAERLRGAAARRAEFQARLDALDAAERAHLEAEAIAMLDAFNRRRYEKEGPEGAGLRALVETNLAVLLDKQG